MLRSSNDRVSGMISLSWSKSASIGKKAKKDNPKNRKRTGEYNAWDGEILYLGVSQEELIRITKTTKNLIYRRSLDGCKTYVSKGWLISTEMDPTKYDLSKIVKYCIIDGKVSFLSFIQVFDKMGLDRFIKYFTLMHRIKSKNGRYKFKNIVFINNKFRGQ